MRRALVACSVFAVALAVTPSAGNERFLRGVDQGRAFASLWHGDGDSVVSPANLTALATMFARLTGGVAVPAETVPGAVRTVHRVQDRSVLETWLVRGMGYAWSGGDARRSHTFPPGPDATEAMVRFLVGL
jgi:poly(3-hydroxybutyrate) depolymerase